MDISYISFLSLSENLKLSPENIIILSIDIYFCPTWNIIINPFCVCKA